jgi:GAF domain-containing protein
MLTWLRQIVAPPVFAGDENRTRSAALLNTLSWMLVVLFLIVTAFGLLQFLGSFSVVGPSTSPSIYLLVASVLAVLCVLVQRLMRQGLVRPASAILVTVLWLLLAAVAIVAGNGLHTPTLVTFVIPVLVGGLLLGWRAGLALAAISIGLGVALLYAETNGLVDYDPSTNTPQQELFFLAITISFSAYLIFLALRGLDQALANSRLYASQLELQQEKLEEAVQQRTGDLTRRARYLETTSEVARDTAGFLDLEALLHRVATLISERFGFYHTGIFLLDPSREWAVLQAASSKGGQRMLARGHRLRVGKVGIVGHATAENLPRIALDVGKDATYFDNPDLPETRSEIALPLRARGQVIGALDVQSRDPDAFSDEDVTALQTLADQVAMAISNARLFQQAQDSLEAQRRAYGELSHQAWRDLLRGRPNLGFVRNRQGISPAEYLWRPEMDTALRTGESALDQDGAERLAIPIKIGGHVIGVIDARRRDEAGIWQPEDIALMETLSEELGQVLEGARLYEDTQRNAAEEQLLGEVTARMRETLNIDTVLRTAIREMGTTLGIAKVEVRMVDSPPGSGNGSGQRRDSQGEQRRGSTHGRSKEATNAG